jgi:hypothetical protein
VGLADIIVIDIGVHPAMFRKSLASAFRSPDGKE